MKAPSFSVNSSSLVCFEIYLFFTSKEVSSYSLSESEKHWLARWNLGGKPYLGKMKQVCGQMGRFEAVTRKRRPLCL